MRQRQRSPALAKAATEPATRSRAPRLLSVVMVALVVALAVAAAAASVSVAASRLATRVRL
jgi:hypothetical protein